MESRCLSLSPMLAFLASAFFFSATVDDVSSNGPLNRLRDCLLVRRAANGAEVGADVPDPYLWWQTRYLLTGDSHRRALRCLDEFLDTHAESQIRDPLERATLQHDLWAVFDWAALDRGPQ